MFSSWTDKVDACYSNQSYVNYADYYCGSTNTIMIDRVVQLNSINGTFGDFDLFCTYYFFNFNSEPMELIVLSMEDNVTAFSYKLFDSDKTYQPVRLSRGSTAVFESFISIQFFINIATPSQNSPVSFQIIKRDDTSSSLFMILLIVSIALICIISVVFGLSSIKQKLEAKEREKRRRRLREIIAFANGIRINGIELGLQNNEQEQIKKYVDDNLKKRLALKEEKDEKCTICQESFEKENEISVLVCSHLFHYECLKEWLYVSKELACPNCKQIILSKPERTTERNVNIIEVRRNFLTAMTGNDQLELSAGSVRIEGENVSSSNRNLTMIHRFN